MPKSNRLSLSERAYQKISELIITIDLAPGKQIDERSLEKALSIGRTPIREALFRLVAEGLVETVPNRGFFVKPLTVEDVKALFEAMFVSERAGALLAGRRAREDDIRRLRHIHRHLEAAIRSWDYLQLTLLNCRFHQTIHATIGNHFLVGFLDHLQIQAQRLSYLSYSRQMTPNGLAAHFARVREHHAAMIGHLQEHNEKAMMHLTTEHLRLFHSRILNYMSPSTEGFDTIMHIAEFGLSPGQIPAAAVSSPDAAGGNAS